MDIKNENLLNFGFTQKRFFPIIKNIDVIITENEIIFKPANFVSGISKINYYETYTKNDFHIFKEFESLIDNQTFKIEDNDIKQFIDKFGYLYTDKNIEKVSLESIYPISDIEYSIDKKIFINELYIFYNITQMYKLISAYDELKGKTIKNLNNWNITKNRIENCLRDEGYNTKEISKGCYISTLSKDFILNDNSIIVLKNCLNILLNYHIKNSNVRILEYKNELISVSCPRDMIGVIYLDYFNYISTKTGNRKVKVCKQCGKFFYIESSKNGERRKYCSEKCKNLYNSLKSNNKEENIIKKKGYNNIYYHNTEKIDEYNLKSNSYIEQYRNKEIDYNTYKKNMKELEQSFSKK